MPFEPITAAKAAPVRRLILNLQGHPKTGKSHWVLATAPEPVWYFCLDPNGIEIARKIVRETGRDIRVSSYPAPNHDQKQDFHKGQLARLKKEITEVCDQNKGTGLIDFSQVYDLVPLALYGKTTQIVQRNWGAIYDELREMIGDAYDSNMSWVYIHKLKRQFVNEKATGDYEIDGWRGLPFEVQANFETMYDTTIAPVANVAGRMRVGVLQNNMNMAMNGWDYEGIPYTQDWFTFDMMLSLTFGE